MENVAEHTSKHEKDTERELLYWCDLLINSTKEIVYNPTKANKFIYPYIFRNIWSLKLFNAPLASVKAYNGYKALSGGLDIRNYDWTSLAKTIDGKRIIINGKPQKVEQLYKFEHMTTAHDFKEKLIRAYKKGQLNKEYVTKLIKEQKICWITIDEDNLLTKNSYSTIRENPDNTLTPEICYKNCGIEIEKK